MPFRRHTAGGRLRTPRIKAGVMAELPVLADGQNLERNGLRCSAYNGGVACGNVSAGVGFFVSPGRYELIQAPAGTASPAPAKPQKPAYSRGFSTSHRIVCLLT